MHVCLNSSFHDSGSVNGENSEWCEMVEKPQPEEDDSEMESGFLFGSFFVPFSGVMRM